MINKDSGDNEHRSPDIGRPKGQGTAIGQNKLEEYVPNNQKDGEFVGRKLQRKNIEGTSHGKAKRDRKPAFLPKTENKEEKGAES